MELIIQLISGAVGGNVAGKLFSKIDQGVLINSIAGIVGGGVGAQILTAVGLPNMSEDMIAGLLSQVAAGGVGGGGLLAIVSVVRGMISK